MRSNSASFATKYRPRFFRDIAGQSMQVELITKMLINGKFPKQTLLSGGSGLGKTTLARIIANSLLCKTSFELRGGAEPCSTCEICLSILNSPSEFPDIIEFDAASYGGKDEIKEIAGKSVFLPMIAKYRIYIIDEAHGLTNQGGQAFLKLLEEPPDHVYFILCTTDPQKMLKTNRGRCVEITLQKPTKPEIVDLLRKVSEIEALKCEEWQMGLVADTFDQSLGVRGLLNSFEKVSSKLGVGENSILSQFELRSILGLSDDSQLITLQENIELGNTKDVLVEIDKIRHHLSEDEIRHSLIEWSEVKLRTTELYQISLWIEFLTGLLEKPIEKNWTDILVVKASEFFRTLTDNVKSVEKKSSTKSDDILIQFINELSDNHPEISSKVNIDDLLYRDNKIIFSNNLSGSLNSEEITVLRNTAGIQGLPLVISQ
jgi:DNA polymerase III subunit gamma/tau